MDDLIFGVYDDNKHIYLVHITVHGRDGKISGLHLFGQPIDLTPCVAVDDGLGDGQSGVEIAEGLEFPFFPFDRNVKLLDT